MNMERSRNITTNELTATMAEVAPVTAAHENE
jgi:hypothetical protein